jgi:XTP/dITP diphosphohydrolase
MVETLLLASSNPGKLREIRAVLEGWPVKVVTPADLGLSLEVEESGQTYAENAARKAMAFASVSGLLTLGDDSGLEVDALGGAPGLYSHRFAPQPGASDADRRVYLLQQLQGKPRPWWARFRCIIALAAPSGEVRFSEGECRGEIIPEERGHGGFGYDPIFFIPEMSKTMAQLNLLEKNRLSHRGRALKAVLPILRGMLAGSLASGSQA